MIAYRVHQTSLNSGDKVPPSTSFFDSIASNKSEKTRAEEFLNNRRPVNLIPRREAVFLFQDIQAAKRWAARSGRHLYSVELEEADISHRADWNWLQLITVGLEAKAHGVEQLADNYWAGRNTETPVWELLARKAKISDEIVMSIPERLAFREEVLRISTAT